MSDVKRGQVVKFSPSERTNKKFQSQKEDYPAIVTEVNENSVDLTVFGVGELVFVTRVQHALLAPEDRSKYDSLDS